MLNIKRIAEAIATSALAVVVAHFMGFPPIT